MISRILILPSLVFLLMISFGSLSVMNNSTYGQTTNTDNDSAIKNTEEFILNLTRINSLVPVVGNPLANVTVIEFGDYQCEHCSEFNKFQKDLLIANYTNSGIAKFTFKDFTVNDRKSGNLSTLAAEASYCAGEQDRYWQYHDKTFRSFDNRTNGVINKSHLIDYATEIGIPNIDQFKECLDTEKYSGTVNDSNYLANQLNLIGTPTFVIYSSNQPNVIKIVQGDQNHTDLEGENLIEGFDKQK